MYSNTKLLYFSAKIPKMISSRLLAGNFDNIFIRKPRKYRRPLGTDLIKNQDNRK